MRKHSIKTTLLVTGILALGAQPSWVNAASLNFDFSRGGSSTDLTGAGNVWTFTDSTGLDISIEARAYSTDAAGTLSKSTVLQGAFDYSQFGYRQNVSAQGLGVCGNGTGLAGCLKKANQFGLNARSETEWLLLTLDEAVRFDSLDIVALTPNKGGLKIFSGFVDVASLDTASPIYSFDQKIKLDYLQVRGVQPLDIQGFGNAILIGANGKRSSVTVNGLQTTVVPIPSAAWLMLSGLLILAGRLQRKR